MSCGMTGCVNGFEFNDAGSGSNVGFMQVVSERFTREELQAIRDKASDLLPWTNMAEFDLLEDLVDILDLLDALAAREEADILKMEKAITEHYPNPGPPVTTCSPGCPLHPRIYGPGVGD